MLLLGRRSVTNLCHPNLFNSATSLSTYLLNSSGIALVEGVELRLAGIMSGLGSALFLRSGWVEVQGRLAAGDNCISEGLKGLRNNGNEFKVEVILGFLQLKAIPQSEPLFQFFGC